MAIYATKSTTSSLEIITIYGMYPASFLIIIPLGPGFIWKFSQCDIPAYNCTETARSNLYHALHQEL